MQFFTYEILLNHPYNLRGCGLLSSPYYKYIAHNYNMSWRLNLSRCNTILLATISFGVEISSHLQLKFLQLDGLHFWLKFFGKLRLALSFLISTDLILGSVLIYLSKPMLLFVLVKLYLLVGRSFNPPFRSLDTYFLRKGFLGMFLFCSTVNMVLTFEGFEAASWKELK